MFIDTHGHLNMMVKKSFDVSLTKEEIQSSRHIAREAHDAGVTTIINVGTSLSESLNCVVLAAEIPWVYATVGLHPNDCTDSWKNDLSELAQLLKQAKEKKIVGIGECGMDRHYPNPNISRQQDAFRAQIELALEYDLALVVHSRNAYDETLRVLEEYRSDLSRSIIHCFSYDQAFADEAFAMNCVLGIGGTVTYPNNKVVRAVVEHTPLAKIVLETDAPFLPPQEIRGQKNHPLHIRTIAEFIAELKQTTVDNVARITTANAQRVFQITQ